MESWSDDISAVPSTGQSAISSALVIDRTMPSTIQVVTNWFGLTTPQLIRGGPTLSDKFSGPDLGREVIRADRSFEYFLRNHVYIAERNPQGDVTGVIKWEWWPDIHDQLVHDLEQEPKIIMLKARQVSVSWSLAAWYVHGAMFTANALEGGVTAGEIEAAEFVWKCQFILDHLPYDPLPTLEKSNTLELEFASSKGRILFFPSTPKAGRGYTFTRWVTDEAAFHAYAARNYAAYLGATVGPIVIVSSAGDDERKVTTDWFQRMWLGARDGTNPFKYRFYPPSVRPGRDEAWKAERRALMAATPGQYEREYLEPPEMAFRSMLRLRFDVEAIEEGAAYAAAVQPMRAAELPQKLQGSPYLTVWATPSPGQPYVIGADGSKGVGADFADAVVMEARTLRTVAEIRSNTMEPAVFGEMVAALAKWYNDAWCMVGRKWGETMLVQLSIAQCRVWHERTAAQIDSGATGMPGFDETGHSKPALIDGLADAIRTRQLSDPSPYFWREASVYILDAATGKTEAASGNHDDTIVARALAVRMAGQPGAQSVLGLELRPMRSPRYHEANVLVRR